MAQRAMNNTERMASAQLKKLGFDIFWHESGRVVGYYATHAQLVSMYCIATTADIAISDLANKLNQPITK